MSVMQAILAANGHLAVEERPLDEAGHSKRKRVPRQMPDALNGCLCGIVVDSQSDGGCETQWIRLSVFHTKKVLYHSPTFKYHLGCVSLDIVPRN